MKEMRRSFIPGDEWVYYKVYCGPKTSEQILTEVFNSISKVLLHKKVIDKWFFVRYNDPEYHIRIRFHCIQKDGFSQVIHELRPLFRNFLDTDLIWKIQLDTYERELERYGSNTIESFEQLFFYDSKMVLQYLKGVNEVEKEQNRWLFGVLVIDTILNHFEYELPLKMKCMAELKYTFGLEFGMNKVLKRRLNQKYTANNAYLDAYLCTDSEKSSFIRTIIDEYVVDSRAHFNSIISEIGSQHLDSKVKSYLHMFLNRLFRSKNRLYEFVIYYFLYKIYRLEYSKHQHKKK